MKLIITVSILFLLFSCNQKDEKFCSCMDISNKLNEKTNQGLNRVMTKSDIKQIQALKKEKDSTCADFQSISGEKALELKKGCEK